MRKQVNGVMTFMTSPPSPPSLAADTGAVIDVLTQTDRDELLKITERRPDVEMLKKVQSFFFERRESLMACAVNRIPVLPGVASFYGDRVGQTASREERGGQVVNRLEIERTGYNPISRQPVLFGSSMKGAIRTALLDHVNKGRPAQEAKGLHELQGRLLGYLNDRGRPILELDPLRLIQLADATCRLDPKLPAAQVRLAVNRKKAEVRDKQGKIRKSLAQDLYQILECVSAWPYRARRAQEKAEQEARLAAMPEEQRAIDALRHLFNRERDAGRKDANGPLASGPLASERVNLLRKASGWESVELRTEAADLIEQTAKYLPWSKKSKEARQQELTKLRQSKFDLT